MEDEERKRKLEAGKAKLAHYRKKKSSSKKKKQETPLSTPRDASHSDEIELCDSTAVETGDDSSARALTPSDDSERSTTTADDISTEEETGYGFQLSPIERIQELELTVSDQQAALQKLTLENKLLREKNTAALAERALAERDSVINELRESVSQSAQHVRQLQQQLTEATSAVIDSGGQQDQIVTELTDTRQKLDSYQTAIVRQEEALQQMAKKLEEKKLEAVEAEERCHSLQVELDKSQSQLISSQQQISDAIRSMQEEFQREKSALKAELDVIHKEEIDELKKEHATALEEELRKRKLMEERHGAVYDPEDARAYREQAELLKSQLETAYRDIDKLKRDHDKEVIDLNQQLVNSVDEYETKLQDERATCEDLEQRLDMADAVSSEIQVSFSKQLQQLEEERDLLRQQLRQSQSQVKENSNSKTKITADTNRENEVLCKEISKEKMTKQPKTLLGLEEEVLSYQTELAQISQRLEEVEKQKRQYRDDMERSQEALLSMKNEKLDIETMNQELNDKISEQNSVCEELKSRIENLNKDQDEAIIVRENKIAAFEKQIAQLLHAADDAQSKTNDEIKSLNREHSEELKNLHSQHHRQMDELKQEMEKQLEATKCELNEARKEQLETVKDVHERSRDREFSRLQETHEAAIRELKDYHVKEIEAVKTEAHEVKQVAEERLRIELKEEFDFTLENELCTLRRNLEREFDLSQAEQTEKHQIEITDLKSNHEEELNSRLETELEKQKLAFKEQLAEQKSELDKAVEKMKFEFDQAQKVMENEHAESLAKMESDVELIQEREAERAAFSSETVEKMKADLKEKTEDNDALTKKIIDLDEQLRSQIGHIEEKYRSNLDSQQKDLFNEKKMLEDKCFKYKEQLEELKEELKAVETERDDVFNQAEESQKRLAVLHHEDSTRMQEEMDQMEAHYQEKVEQMQYEIESLRASRGDLQELRKQLETRNASVDEMSRIHEDFAEEKQKLLEEIRKHEDLRETMEKEYDEQMDKLKNDHHSAMEKEHERITQLLRDLEEHKEKLDEVTSSAIPLESSPMRSLSQMSDYDSANVAALNKDYRSAMTLTHVSGVSGLSETLEPPIEEPNSELIEQIESLKKDLEGAQAEIERQKKEREQAISDMKQQHDEKIDELTELSKKKLIEAEQQHSDDLSLVDEKHGIELSNVKEAHQKEIMQIHMQCAANTAEQIEQETASIRQQLSEDFQAKIDSLKQQMELESDEKLEAAKLKHDEELTHQTSELSQSMEVRISAVMGELHEQKQEALQKASLEHDKELTSLKKEFDQKLEDALKKEEALASAWKDREQTLENLVQNLESEVEKSKEDYRNLLKDLDSGSNEHLISLQSKHEEDLERQRMRLVHEYEERQEKALQKQADTYENAQSEFMKLHKEQFDKFVTSQKKDSEEKENETNKRIDEVRKQLMAEWDAEKEGLIASHAEEMKVVATKLVQIDAEKENAENLKNDLISQIDELQSQHQQDITEMKAALVDQHMMKFQEVTVNLDQLHKEEMEGVREQHHEKVKSLREEIDSYQERVDVLEGELRKERERLETMVPSDEVEQKLKDQIENHDEEVKRIQTEHDVQLQQIQEEIAKQTSEYEESMQKILSSQSGDLNELKQQFDESLRKAVEAGNAEIQKKQERIVELEAELSGMDELRAELEDTRRRKEEMNAVVEEWKLKIQAWEEDRNEEREAYEAKLDQLSQSLNNMREEYKDLNARIEFERVEYETELENAQEETRNKEENIKELNAEIEHKNAALDSLVRQHEQLTERNERENTEGENLVKMLRDDLERINKERDSIHSSNEQLLSVLSDLVRSNHKCEEIIAKRLENLPIMSSSDMRQQKHRQTAGAEGTDSDSSNSPPCTSLSGSFVDEGLDLSQRFSESLFAGPELDTAARDVITTAGSRVGQATERLLDMLDSTIKKLNASQHAQTLLSNELERVLAGKQDEDDRNNDDVIAHEEALQEQTTRISELEKLVSDLERQLQDAAAEKNRCLAVKDDEVNRQFVNLKEEKALLQKQREALAEGRDATELQLLQTTEELAHEKSLLMERHQQERDRLTETAQALEETTVKQAKAHEERENEYLNQIEDLNSQIACLRKRTESGSRFTAELTEDRELERDQFERAMEEMRIEIDQARDVAKSEALLAQKVAHLEEELDAKLKSEDDRIAEIDQLKEDLEQKETLITDLREHIDSQQTHDSSSYQLDLQTQLDESRRQEEVLQKELYDTMLRISALEAQLDRYRHGLDEDAIAALEKSEAEERRLKEIARQQVEDKEQEVEVLVEQQGVLRKQIIEKEEEVERLLQEMDEMDDLKAENILLKESLKTLKAQVNEQPVSKSDQMEALSQQLLDDKNAEIDDLRQQMALLQSDNKDAGYQQALTSLQAQIHELDAENQRLKEEMDQMQERVEENRSFNHPIVMEEVVQKSSASQEDTGIQDLSAADLTRAEIAPTPSAEVDAPAVDAKKILEENNDLHQRLQEARAEAADLLQQVEQENLLKLSPEIKEKIRDVEEMLEKYEAEELQSDDEQVEDLAATNRLLSEKLDEIDVELRSHPFTVLGRILTSMHKAVCDKQQLIEDLKNQLSKEEDLPDSNQVLDEPAVAQSSSSESEEEQTIESSVSEKNDEDSDISLNEEVLQLKALLSEKEDAILKRDVTVAKQQDLVNERDNRIAELTREREELNNKLNDLSDTLHQSVDELEEIKKLEESLTLENSDLRETIEKMQQDLTKKSKNELAAEEINRLFSQLSDVQKECASLLEDNQKLDREKCAVESELSDRNDVIKQLEVDANLLREHQAKAEKKEIVLTEKIQNLHEELQGMKKEILQSEKAKEEIEVEYEKLRNQGDLAQAEANLQPAHIVHAGGDNVAAKASLITTPTAAEESSIELERLLHENESLKEEISNLTFKTEELQIELDLLKQSHVTEQNSAIGQSDSDVDQLQHMYESTRIEPPQARKSLSSSSSAETVHEQIEELKKEYQKKIEVIKNTFAQELEEAVARAAREQESLDQRKLTELEEKHRQEITELLSESGIGENELAQKLRAELDLADKLDNELINQLTSAAQRNVHLLESEPDSIGSASPEKDAEISTRLQHLLSRLHNEGVQVLSLSELQFLKQHQPNKNVSMNTDPQEASTTPNVDVEGLRRAWESEKLALLDAIQALKELLTQTATDSAQLTDDDDDLRWRGELLRSVADLFEREKHALLAELRANVIEAHGETEEPGAASRLEALEQKIRNQEMQHQSELERLLAADRDQLADDVKQLKTERKEKLEQAYSRIEQLQERNKVAEESGKIAVKQLQNEVECLKGKLEQEQVLTSDLRASLHLEKQRSNDLVPALEKERQRTLELSTEIASLSDDSDKELQQLKDENENLRTNVRVLTQSLAESDVKLEGMQRDCDTRQNALIISKQQQDQTREKDHELIANLRNTIAREEAVCADLENALRNEKNKVDQLKLEVASEKGKMLEEVTQWKNRCEDLTNAVQGERERCEKLQSALEREASQARRIRLDLDNERKMTSEARDHERATIADLQTILEDAKQETEKVQRRVHIAEQDRDNVIRRADQERSLLERKLAQEQVSKEEAMDRERLARIEFQTALDTERIRKEDLEKRMQELEKHHRETLKNQELTPSKNADSLMTSRRQLESLRQRLQLEASKFQNIVDRTSGKPSPRLHLDSGSPTNSLLSSDGEKFESVKRSLQDMQGELKDLYSELYLPQRASESRGARPSEFNDRLLKHNAELAQFAADAAKETRELRASVEELHRHHQRHPRISGEDEPQASSDSNQQKMANRIHKLYTRYLRAESFRKSLVYQKKYLLLLLGGFQDCEEATLAMIARMGAYPSDDALRRTVTQRSAAFTRFRSAARVVIAVCRLKYLVRKWKKANSTVSTAIQNKHGITVIPSSAANGVGASHDSQHSPSPSPRLDYLVNDLRLSGEHHQPVRSHSPSYRYSNDPPSHDTSPFTSSSHVRASASPYSPHVSFSHGYNRDRPYIGDHRRYSPTPTHSYSAVDRSSQVDTDPSLNDYIQKLENIQTKLRYPR